MDKALVYGTRDSGFDLQRSRDRNEVADKLPSLGRQQPMEGMVFAVSPGDVTNPVDDEQRRWGECLLVDEPTISTCRRVDPGG
ncbi:hypothetical protein V6N12_051646 [Hibiscus sabdariffa]|uniref:Uncharacterized protein n=1 Tax=Hibiscus sabdariffa TaxID=183260 RepID=A0ABR2GFX2_9ROSI